MAAKSTKVAAVLVALVTMALGIGGQALAEKATVVRAGNLVLRLNGGVGPQKLPKNRLAPITLRASGNIGAVDGTHPPATKEVTIDFDKHGTINARGLPACKSGKLQSRSTTAAKSACPKAIVGKGSTTVEVAFPEQKPFTASGPLVLFNGGVKAA